VIGETSRTMTPTPTARATPTTVDAWRGFAFSALPMPSIMAPLGVKSQHPKQG
jgi:hypothetical protein